MRKSSFALEQLPYCLGGALTSLLRAVQLQEEIVSCLDLSRFGPNTEYSIPDEDRDRIAYQVDAFFESAVRVQNALGPYLQFRFKQSLPSSFRALVEQLTAGSLSLSPGVDGALTAYWTRSGQRLRSYRDLSQHFVVLASNARIVITNSQFEGFFLPLPHNPEAKRPSELIYDNDSPNALPYILDSFVDLVRTVRAVTREVLGTDRREPRGVTWHMFKEGGLGLPARHARMLPVREVQERLDVVANE
jgi:hypothetical protein